MARFTFQLEGVLRHRKNIERERQRQLALLQAQMQEQQGQLRRLDQSMKEATGDLRQNRLVGSIDLSFLAAHRRFVLSIQRQATALMQKMALLQRQIDEARAALAEAAKQRKIIEKLREKRHQAWLADLGKRQAEEMDEIGMQLSYRQVHLPAATGGEQ